MGWLKDVFDPGGAESEREREMMAEKRLDYPVLDFNINEWIATSNRNKILYCQDIGSKMAELRLLKANSIETSAISDAHRVDERAKRVYTQLLNEYSDAYERMGCDPILNKVTLSNDRIKLEIKTDNAQKRIEQDIEKQRTIIIGVGGVVLLLGTFLIVRKV
jgi:hypothetical protein